MPSYKGVYTGCCQLYRLSGCLDEDLRLASHPIEPVER